MRLNYDDDDKVEVQMSPLIDCVFLLLIFFFSNYDDEKMGNADSVNASYNDFKPFHYTGRQGSGDYRSR